MNPKQTTIRATAEFLFRGRAPVEIGEVISVPEHLARELINANKAEAYTAPPEAQPTKTTDAVEPAPKAASENVAATGSKKR